MAEKHFLHFLIIFLTLFSSSYAQGCSVPLHFHGDWFSIEHGNDIDTLINEQGLIKNPGENPIFNGRCMDLWNDNSTVDADGNFDSYIMFFDSLSSCYQCFQMLFRTPNVVQYKQSNCRTQNEPPTLQEICEEIGPGTDMRTWFKKTMSNINCKNTVEGVYQFRYEWDVGGGGICDSPNSRVIGCQEPGSPYVDNQVFFMNFAKCPQVTTSRNNQIKFQCMGTWKTPDGNIWSGLADLGREVWRERFRCMLTREDQEEDLNRRRATMSWWAQCSTLKSPFEGPLRLLLTPVVDQNQYIEPHCILPQDYTGTWYYTSEYDVDVTMNLTHIYFRTKIDQWWYKESYFICQMYSDSRYLMTAITVGKCEVDFVCMDMLPRHHSIVRWRMSKPYRLTQTDIARRNWREYMYRQACTWSSFTLDRNDVAWKYKTFILNPPAPTRCPVMGRYLFSQRGLPTELFRTRIRGYTERPRHQIDCRRYITEYKSCDEQQTKIFIDAEYCDTIDHTARPVGEYDEADHELDCVGHWDEDLNSYMITYEPEDPVSTFRCWNYERLDWRHILLSRSTSAACGPDMSSRSWHPSEGASLALYLTENERLFDDCPQLYVDGDPYNTPPEITRFDGATSLSLNSKVIFVLIALSLLLRLS